MEPRHRGSSVNQLEIRCLRIHRKLRKPDSESSAKTKQQQYDQIPYKGNADKSGRDKPSRLENSSPGRQTTNYPARDHHCALMSGIRIVQLPAQNVSKKNQPTGNTLRVIYRLTTTGPAAARAKRRVIPQCDYMFKSWPRGNS